MTDQLVADFGFKTIAMKIQTIPKEICVMTACSGSGMCELVASAIAAEMNHRFHSCPSTDLHWEAQFETRSNQSLISLNPDLQWSGCSQIHVRDSAVQAAVYAETRPFERGLLENHHV